MRPESPLAPINWAASRASVSKRQVGKGSIRLRARIGSLNLGRRTYLADRTPRRTTGSLEGEAAEGLRRVPQLPVASDDASVVRRAAQRSAGPGVMRSRESRGAAPSHTHPPVGRTVQYGLRATNPSNDLTTAPQ